jgi:hypothetical protein
MNVLFVGGHVATVQIGISKDNIEQPSGELAKIYLLKK